MFKLVSYKPTYRDGLVQAYRRVWAETDVYDEHWEEPDVIEAMGTWTDCFLAINTGTDAVIGFVAGQPFTHKLKLAPRAPISEADSEGKSRPDSDTDPNRWIQDTQDALGSLAKSAYYVAELGVLKEFQAYGLGSLLLRHLTAYVSMRNYESFVLRTSAAPNNPALPLYDSLRFHPLYLRTAKEAVPVESGVMHRWQSTARSEPPQGYDQDRQAARTPTVAADTGAPVADTSGPEQWRHCPACNRWFVYKADTRRVYYKIAHHAGVSRYNEDDRVAQFVEADWFDVVRAWPDVDQDVVRPPLFPPERSPYAKDIVETVLTAASREHVPIRTACDVGSGAGRFVYELRQRAPDIAVCHVVEPSRVLMAFNALFNGVPEIFAADRFKSAAIAKPKSLPMIATNGAVVRLPIGTIPQPGKGTVDFWLGKIDDLPVTVSADLVACLNVLDRDEEPRALIGKLAGLVRTKGLLVLASPLDWHPLFTPAADQHASLRDFFKSDGRAREAQGEAPLVLEYGRQRYFFKKIEIERDEYEYVFREHPRKQTVFRSQLLVLQRVGDEEA